MNPLLTTIPLADTWGMQVGTGFVIAMVVMMVLCMGAMMFGMARMGRSSTGGWSMPWNRLMGRESPRETLERRFAEGEISVEEYRARREVLVDGGAGGNGAGKDETSTASRGEGRR